MGKLEQCLRDLSYYPESPVAYSGINKIWNKAKAGGYKISIPEVEAFLENQPTYISHNPIMKRFPFRKTMVSSIDQQWQADLVDMQRFEKQNKGYIFIFSRYAWALPLKSKRGEEVKDLFVEVFKEAKPEKVQFDEGKEFYNKYLKDLLEKNNIE
jgi:hypothetical protein